MGNHWCGVQSIKHTHSWWNLNSFSTCDKNSKW